MVLLRDVRGFEKQVTKPRFHGLFRLQSQGLTLLLPFLILGDCVHWGNSILRPERESEDVTVKSLMVSAEQYLHSSFEHDAEFVEGRLVERPAPTWEHASMQGFLIEALWVVCPSVGFFAVPEQRVQTRPDRFRVPDVCVLTDKPEGESGRRIVTRPAYLCVEVLSPEDTAVDTVVVESMDKVREYLHFGVAWVWVIDPVSLTGQVHSRNGVVGVEDRIFSTDRFSVDISQAGIAFQIE